MTMISTCQLKEFFETTDIKYRFNNIPSAFERCEALDSASEGAISWAGHRVIKSEEVSASVLIISETAEVISEKLSVFYVENPRLIFARIVKNFFEKSYDGVLAAGGYIHPDAVCHESLIIGKGSSIGANCEVGANVVIEQNVVIHSDVIIKDSVYIQSGVVIGSAGYGYVKNELGAWEHFPHVGGVVLECNVEIGANTCIDRGTLGNTSIGQGSKVSNLCQIAHNVKIEENCLIAGKAQIGGGSIIGRNTYIGPSAIISNKINIAENSDVKIGSVVVSDVDGEVSGNFAMPHKRNLMNYIKIMKGKK